MIYRFEEINSTNLFAKTLLPAKENALVIAKKQTGGMGTKGRSFSSNEGGIYLTKLDFYEDFLAKDAFLIMAKTSTAVCKTLERFGLFPVIKWANDVFIEGKKVCGILIENTFAKQNLSSSIIGMGLNVNNTLPSPLSAIAISMKEAGGKEYPLEEVERELISQLNSPFTMEEYQKRLGFLGEKATLIEGEKEGEVLLLSVDEKGVLYVEEKGKIRGVLSGEVSLKLHPKNTDENTADK